MKAFLFVTVIIVGAVLAPPGPAFGGGRVVNLGQSADASAHDSQALVVSIPNHRSKAEARRQVDKALAGIERDYGFFLTIEHEAWTGDRLRLRARILGQSAVGRIDVKKTRVNLRILLPGSLSFLVGLAQPAILKAGTKMLASKKETRPRVAVGMR